MTEYDFTLSDRITKIKSINDLYDLEHNAYISFSGGKDSTVLHYLIDKALPNNNIPRLFLNTGIEYKAVLDFVKSMAQNDSRIIIYNSGVNIKQMLNDKGYPFKSKEHANKVSMYKNNSKSEAVKKYIENVGTRYGVPKILEYQFKEQLDFKISDRCCFELKKNIAHKWAVENNKTITLTGMRSSEGGQRSGITCAIFNKGKLKKFHPLAPVDDNFMAQFLQRERERVALCSLYYPPYNFNRTGCAGCPFATDLQKELDIMKYLLPKEYKKCNYIWKPVYDEYKRIGYRLRKDNGEQELFD